MASDHDQTGEADGINRLSASKWASLPIGRWLLMTVVIGWFALLILNISKYAPEMKNTKLHAMNRLNENTSASDK